MRNQKKSQQGMFKQHTKPYKAGVGRLLSTKMAMGLQSPKNHRIRPRELSAELQKCGKWKIIHILDTLQSKLGSCRDIKFIQI